MRIDDGNERAVPGAAWPICGLLGGAVTGILDAVGTIPNGAGGIDVAKTLWLVMIGVSIAAAAGGLLGLLVSPLARVAARLKPRLGLAPEAMLAALLATPLLLYDALSLFRGRRAALVPGHALLSWALVLGGVVAVYAAARCYQKVLCDRGPMARRLTAVALVLVAVGAELANRNVLPRLYPWFHATLSLLTLLSLVLAARLGIENRRGHPSSRHVLWRRLAPLVVGLVLGTTTLSLWKLRHSHALTSAVYERTRLVALVAPALPGPVESEVAAVNPHDGEHDSAALPAGPRYEATDVVLITVDALRADHIGVYGYGRGTTPAIDRLAQRAVRFERAYAQAPHTSFSITSMLTSTYFPSLARVAANEAPETIATVLRNHGWVTTAFYPPAIFTTDASKLAAYANAHYGFEHAKVHYLDAQGRVDEVIAFFAGARPKRAFVWVHLFEPHEPYEEHPAFPFGKGDVDRYDSEIAQADAAIGRLVAWLDKHRPGALVVLTADHGEEFEEHGGRYHGSTLYDEQVRVPLLLAVPGVGARVVRGPVELVDLPPTLLNLLGLPVPASMRGTDLGPWLATPAAAERHLPPAFAEIEDKRMVVRGTEKLVCDLDWGFCAYHDLARDPREERNAADEAPEAVARLRHELDDWLDSHARPRQPPPMAAVDADAGAVPRAIARGRLGDLMVASELTALLARDVPVAFRQEAARLLATLPPRGETAPALAHVTADPDALVAAWATVATVRLGDHRRKKQLRRLVHDESLPRPLRLRGALVLGAVGDHSGVMALARGLDDCTDMQLCRLITAELGRMKDARAVPALLDHLGEVQTRRETVEALGDIGDGRASDALIDRLLHDEYVPVRVQAAIALAKLGLAAAIPALQQAADQDSELMVVEAARRAIAALTDFAGS